MWTLEARSQAPSRTAVSDLGLPPHWQRTRRSATLDTNNYQYTILGPIETAYISVILFAIRKRLRDDLADEVLDPASGSSEFSFRAAILRWQIGRSSSFETKAINHESSSKFKTG